MQYIGQHIHCACEIRATNLCHQTHFIDHIMPTLCMTSHSAYVWHLSHYTRHHILTLWHQTTVFMTSHPLYLTLYPLYLCHHIHCIDDITPKYLRDLICYIWWHHMHCKRHHIHHICYITATVFGSSHMIYQWHHTKYGIHHTWHTYDIIHSLHDITFILYDINAQYLWHHNHCIHDIRSPIYDFPKPFYDISSPISVTSQPVHH